MSAETVTDVPDVNVAVPVALHVRVHVRDGDHLVVHPL